jgi:hypothetical protein
MVAGGWFDWFVVITILVVIVPRYAQCRAPLSSTVILH